MRRRSGKLKWPKGSHDDELESGRWLFWMPREETMRWEDFKFPLDDRREVLVATGRKTQTINVCQTGTNSKDGQYELTWEIEDEDLFLRPKQVPTNPTYAQLVKLIESRGGRLRPR